MTQNVVIGKYTIETLTNGMYATPLDLFREYIQNSVDSIDESCKELGGTTITYSIKINVCSDNNTITIYDDGMGICQEKAAQLLVDIGNSRKVRGSARGFRGIGRLSGLGYCDTLCFITSAKGEAVKTVVSFDAQKLKKLLLNKSDAISANDVLSQVISIKTMPEKQSVHYFKVELGGVVGSNTLLDVDTVRDYLVQNAPLRFDKEFKWQKEIIQKMETLGYKLHEYRIYINDEELFKPYSDYFVSDRARKNTDSIKNIEVVPILIGDKTSAILWCAETNYYGTVISNAIKGIRIRQGNILIGNNHSFSQYFKEERFNGWLIGELHVIDPELIINARRDDFERTENFYKFEDEVRLWTIQKSKEIRKVSYSRSLPLEKRTIVEAEQFGQVSSIIENSLECINGESTMIDISESEEEAQTDYINKLSALINQKKNNNTKYMALNANEKLTYEQRKVLERVFDLVIQKYNKNKADEIINFLLNSF